MFFRKTSKAFEQLHYDNAQQLQQISAQKLRITELSNKRRKKITINPTERFANIEQIIIAQQEQEQRQREWERRNPERQARATALQVQKMNIESMTVVFNAVEQH